MRTLHLAQNLKFSLPFTLIICFIFIACRKEKGPPPVSLYNTGKIQISFLHNVQGKPLQFDTLMYINAAGNQYKIHDLEYFISELIFYKHDGSKTVLKGSEEIHYIDNRISSSMTWKPADNIPEGKYDSVTFIFGLTAEKNITGTLPEVNMVWPDMIGGGYHYMMLNGFWKGRQQTLESLNFHLGIGQIYEDNNPIPVSFVQNYFTVNLPNSDFTLYGDMTNKINIIMNIEKWFNGPPYIFDFNKDGYDTIMHAENIMKNQNAMSKMKANGKNVFTFSIN
jgi:hypothetical protein